MKLLAAISHHGLGHLAQAAPVLNALGERVPELELTIWSDLAADALAARVRPPFERRAGAADMGLIMADAVRVDVAASHAAYLDFHAGWERRVAREADWLRAQGYTAVFSDVAYLPLAAAARAEIPGVALCSLNWFDIARAYLHGRDGMAPVLAEMAAAYGAASAFLRVTPAMPMAWLENGESVPPIAARGEDRRGELIGRLGLDPACRLVLAGFGGIGYGGVSRLPRVRGVVWLVPDAVTGMRDDLLAFRDLGMPFLDLLASCDALLTKVGYGGFVEAAAHAKPVLYVDRPDWPETPYLAAWLRQFGNAVGTDEAELFSDACGRLLQQLWRCPGKAPVDATGAAVAARRFLELVGAGPAQ